MTEEEKCGGQKEEEGKGKDKEPLSGSASLTRPTGLLFIAKPLILIYFGLTVGETKADV